VAFFSAQHRVTVLQLHVLRQTHVVFVERVQLMSDMLFGTYEAVISVEEAVGMLKASHLVRKLSDAPMLVFTKWLQPQ
jgi:hypothetical protein